MRKQFVLLLCGLALGGAAQADSFVNVGAVIPDNDPNGYQSSQSLTLLPLPIAKVTVTLNVSGGVNGDLYAFLSHNNTMAVLLNRVGRTGASALGYPDAGFGPDGAQNSFTFDDQAGYDVHYYRTVSYLLNGSGQLTGIWQPDGRVLDPESPGSQFETAARSNMLALFNGMDGNGLWTLYVADLSPLGESTLVSWGLNITMVPEPAPATLLGCALAGGLFWRLGRRVRARAEHSRFEPSSRADSTTDQ
jgi:subtilisin-like proprotein convertase family protein